MQYPFWSCERARSHAALSFEPSGSDFVFSLFSRLSFFALVSTPNSSRLPGSGTTRRCGIGTRSCRDNLQNQWRRDARVLGLSATLCSDDTHADLSLLPYCGSWVAFSLGCQPGSNE